MDNQSKDLPPGWIEAPLEKVVKILDHLRIPVSATERALRLGDYPYYGANGQAGTIDDYIFDGDYALLAEDGGHFDNPARGVAYRATGKFWVNNHAHILKPLCGMDTTFIVNYLNSIKWMPYVSGTTRLKLTQGSMRQVPFILPPLKEQKRIAKKIVSLQSHNSKARNALEAIPPLLEKFRQSVLSSAFMGDLTADWRAQNPDIEPAEKLLERILKERRKRWEEDELAKMKAKGQTPKDDKWKKKYKEPEPVDTTDLPELPEGWCWVALEEISEKVTDGTHQPPPFTISGIPFLVIRNIIKGMIDWEGVNKWVTESTYEKYTSNCKPEKGDVLYSAVGSYGVAVEVLTDRTFMFQRHIAHIKPVRNVVSPRYIMLSLNSPSSLDQAHKVARGVAQKTVTLTYLRRFNLALPPEKEQHEIIKRVNKALHLSENIKTSVEKSLSQAELLDQSILSKAFRGELVPQDPNDEPAFQLLERIKQEKASPESEKKKRARRGRTAKR